MEPEELSMIIQCNPIDMTVPVRRRMVTPQYAGQCSRPASIEELAMPPQNFFDDILDYLEVVNSFFVNAYLGQIFLLFLTIFSLTSFAIMYCRCTHMQLDVNDMQQKVYDMQVEKYQAIGKLAKCEYESKLMKEAAAIPPSPPSSLPPTPSSPSPPSLPPTQPAPIFDDIHSKHDMGVMEQEYSVIDYPAKNHEIYPTKSSETIDETVPSIDKTEKMIEDSVVIPSLRDHHGRLVWKGDNEVPLQTKLPHQPKSAIYKLECEGGEHLLSSDKAKFCDDLQKRAAARAEKEFIYSTQVTYNTEKHECKLADIDLSMGLKHARNILRELKCDDETSMKYIQDAFDRQQTATKESDTKLSKEHKKLEEFKAKWEKINFDDYAHNDNSSEERFNEKKERHDKKYRKDGDKDKKNRKESKKFKEDKENHDNKWAKIERKRDSIKVYDRRYND